MNNKKHSAFYRLNFQIETPFENLFRNKHVLIAGTTQDNCLVLAEKDMHYPDGIYRLPGGGIETNELPQVAAVREAEEEMGIKVKVTDLNHLFTVEANCQDQLKARYKLTTYVYRLGVDFEKLKATDDITGLRKLDLKDIKGLIQKYKSLPQDFYYQSDRFKFSWADYGKVYGKIHQLVLEKLGW